MAPDTGADSLPRNWPFHPDRLDNRQATSSSVGTSCGELAMGY
jgi:hypothetical protein